MRMKYETPVIQKCQTGLMNKFGSCPHYSRKIRTGIDDVSIDNLVEKYGSPLFVFSEKTLRERFREIHRAFSTRYPNVTFAWSYKTNYLPAICAVFHQEGAIAEVVSEMEYDKARKLGVPGDKIIFNGPYKSLHALEKAVSEGAMVHIDHLDEIYDLEKVADKLGRKIKVALRLNMDTGIRPQWSRFGFNVDSGQAMMAARRIHHGGKLIINGLHCHIGTFILEPDAYGVQVEKMLKLAYQIEDQFKFGIEYIDIGGGFPSKSKLKGTYLSPDLSVPAIDDYAEKITSAFYKNLRPGDFPRLILESGRVMVDEAGYLITTIHSSKRMPDGRKAYVVDAGVNILFTSFWYKFKLEIDREVQGVNEPSIVYGPLCMNIDVIDEGCLLPPLNRGTRLIVSPVGAYNVTQWLQFISYRPNVVLTGENGKVDVIREAEDLLDIERRERLPEHLLLSSKSS
ncbi:MAG: alanine racemase [Candidatus Eremiobacteraeota bacterium]|nr:alanine racemase [Candidatus Eremiobacteraeota bacterium]